MTVEYKSFKAAPMGIDGRTVTGIAVVHGNVDDGDGWSSRDRTHPGLFGDFTVDGRDRVKFLWSHRAHDPPIAAIEKIFEVSRADLPPAVKQYAPDATGGVAVARTYLATPKGDEVLAGIVAGAITEMSYAYEAKRWDFEKQDDAARMPPVRNIYEATLLDLSDVNWGMNNATSATGAKALGLVAHGDTVKAALAAYTERVQELAERRAKEGRVFSAANYTALKALADDLDALGIALRELLAQSEPKQAIDLRGLLLDYERAVARINGVAS